jgi:UDP-N-acetyl-D-glucosamine dehydrogenase
VTAPAPRVGVIGLGYVGLPLAVVFAEAGVPVVGLDVVDEKVAAINRGISHIEDVPSERLAPLVQAGTLRASTDLDELPALEDEMCDFGPGGLSSGRSPDRLDALVWATRAETQAAVGALRPYTTDSGPVRL